MRHTKIAGSLIVGVLLAAVACTASNEPYPAEAARRLTELCTAAGETQSLCSCVAARIEETFPYDEFVEEEERFRLGKGMSTRFASRFVDALTYCIDK